MELCELRNHPVPPKREGVVSVEGSASPVMPETPGRSRWSPSCPRVLSGLHISDPNTSLCTTTFSIP